MALQLSSIGVITIINHKVAYSIILPEQITQNQLNVFVSICSEIELEFLQGKILTTAVYSSEKLEYHSSYRDLDIENKINNSNLTSYEQLDKELMFQQENLKNKKISTLLWYQCSCNKYNKSKFPDVS